MQSELEQAIAQCEKLEAELALTRIKVLMLNGGYDQRAKRLTSARRSWRTKELMRLARQIDGDKKTEREADNASAAEKDRVGD